MGLTDDGKLRGEPGSTIEFLMIRCPCAQRKIAIVSLSTSALLVLC